MRFGVNLPYTLGPREAADLARLAEEAGWDGVFYWDGIQSDEYDHAYDPWVTLAAMAMRTERVRLGPMITPLARRRPWKLARETVSLDHLSGGRLTLCAGLGWVPDGGFSRVGEATDRQTRAERLDEGLAVVDALWKAEPLTFHGRHYQVEDLRLAPPPLQSPRIPVWVVARWPYPKSIERALQWDGAIVEKQLTRFEDPRSWNLPAEEFEAIRARAASSRAEPFDIVIEGDTCLAGGAARELPRRYAAAGVTWWLESVWTSLHAPGIPAIRERIEAGPPGTE
jgi:alkanesulfonate monooxygenase SsuD/methylene tetrahydromethanopterin reductase-like flavin-dependent oxidoreductase (luciferase family)